MAYTLSDLQSSIQSDLKDPSFSSDNITRYLNRGLSAIFNTHLFKFTEKAVSGALTIGEHTYEQQDDHESTIGGSLTDPDNTDNVWSLDHNNYLSHREFFERFPDPSIESSGQPTYWTEFGDQVYFNCPVDKEYVFKQRYYRTPTFLSSGTDVPGVPETFRELLETYALYRAEKYRGNHDIAATYRQDFEDGLESMVMRYSPRTSVGPAKMRQHRTRVDV